MAEKKFSLEGFDLRSGGINDLPELAVEPNSPGEKAGKLTEEVTPALRKTEQVSLIVEKEEEDVPAEPAPRGFLGLLGKVRSTLPLIARVLPLLDNGLATALAPVASSLIPGAQNNSKALEHALSEVQSGHRDLRSQLQNQGLQLKRVDEQLVRIREEVDHNSREYQEKLQELRSATGTVKGIAIFALLLLLVIAGLQGWLLYLFLHR